jgi:hypothetical protein
MTVLLGLIALWTVMVFTRSDVETTFLRAPGSLFQEMPDGRFSNLYTVKVVNKTSRDIPVELRLENTPGTLQVMGGEIVVPREKLAETSVLIHLAPSVLQATGTTPLQVGVYSKGRLIQTLKTSFIGPRR